MSSFDKLYKEAAGVDDQAPAAPKPMTGTPLMVIDPGIDPWTRDFKRLPETDPRLDISRNRHILKELFAGPLLAPDFSDTDDDA